MLLLNNVLLFYYCLFLADNQCITRQINIKRLDYTSSKVYYRCWVTDVLEGGRHRSDYAAYMGYICLQSNEKLLVNYALFHETSTNINSAMLTLPKLGAVFSLISRGFLWSRGNRCYHIDTTKFGISRQEIRDKRSDY